MLVWKLLMIVALIVFAGSFSIILDDARNKKATFSEGVVITLFGCVIFGLAIGLALL